MPLQEALRVFGKEATFFTSSHERSHIMMAIGMAPRHEPGPRAVLVWEGAIGNFYLVDERCRVERTIPVLSNPGSRFAFLFALADPLFPDQGAVPRLEDSGKLMALAAFGDARDADPAVAATVERILEIPEVWPAPKGEFRDSPALQLRCRGGGHARRPRLCSPIASSTSMPTQRGSSCPPAFRSSSRAAAG